MNRSKNAALLMLLGAFAAGGGSVYAGSAIMKSRPRPPECPRQQQRSERDFRANFYKRFEFDSAQIAANDALVNARDSAVRELFAAPRAQAESVMDVARARYDSIMEAPRVQRKAIVEATQAKQNALFTPAQKAKLDAQNIAWEIRRREETERRALCEAQQQKQAPAQGKEQSTKNKSNH